MKKTVAESSKKSLYRELTIGLISLVFLGGIVVSGIGYSYLSYQTKHLYQQKTTEYQRYLYQALEWPLWNMDNELVEKIANAFAANAEVGMLIVRDDQNPAIYRHS